jgi:hypothetical protein
MTRSLLAHASIALLLGACSRCHSTSGGSDGGASLESAEVVFPARVAPPHFVARADAKGFGLPAGCRLDGPIRVATLADGHVRFNAIGQKLDLLAIAEGESGGASKRAGIVDLGAESVGDAPWAEVDAPPLFGHASSGSVAVWAVSAGPAKNRVLFWRGDARAEQLLDGDGLGVVDLECRGETCAVLSTLARSAAAPGATLEIGKAAAPMSGFSRVDFEPSGNDTWHPVSIAGFDGTGSGWVALGSKSATLFMSFAGGKSVERDRIATPEGVFGALVAKTPLVVAPGAPLDRPCGPEEFPLLVLGPGGAKVELRTPAAPESVVVRRLGAGAIAAWVAPVSCQYQNRRVVYAALIGPDGSARSSPMAIGDATGFALSTSGSELGLWLVRDRELAWIRGRCELEAADGG